MPQQARVLWATALLLLLAPAASLAQVASRKLANRGESPEVHSARRLSQAADGGDGGQERVSAAAAQLAAAIAQGEQRVPAAAADLARPVTPSGQIPPDLPSPPSPQPSTQFGAKEYSEVLEACYLFYEAQRSGRLPTDNRVAWRADAHVNDLVPGGWYDAGDYIKHALTVAKTATFLAWGAVDFQGGHERASQLQHARAAVKWAADYLRGCHLERGRCYVGLIGNPDIDHTFWGRPQDQPVGGTLRPVYSWNRTMAASDLLGTVAASLASASVLLRPVNATDADSYRDHAEQLYAWGASLQGMYSKSQPGYPWVYSCSRYHDKLMLAAGWLYRATGNASYLQAAHRHWRDAGGIYGTAGSVNPYVSWDSLYAPAAALLLNVGSSIGASAVPGRAEYASFFSDFSQIWVQATGSWGIVKTPKGLRLANWSKWGNLRYAANVAFTVLLRANQLPAGAPERASLLAFARSQVDYAMGSAGRSYVVGWGVNPPLRPHHAAASCPSPPASCSWAEFGSPAANPQVLRGALVGGPAGPGDDTYYDERDDYVTNEVAIDYNAGLTPALAGLLAMLA
ncbi:hypothetical protein CHLNCDRAFT_133737 [Chlorella variabilis]|uniref:Endoglucanase n=1 Tax=Chlorella variabilis TaxID=554065 RepID=E1ZF54_CHLVA|nr:hypothetical protein CHLNCDRAFT_133737 [Chlorella variabilis]EFN55441.1 hypothetical protein CHLNCDRAFT_133737 [Chlorella variabilis]|eukprot:XP_005847543.1 hypothetical protein CHLNCDRAFT_133737 [Chlorella variabilis]